MLKNRSEVLKLSFSAFFADLGYQAAVASFPLIFVIYFGAPIYLYGLAEAINYGGGTLMSFLGGKLSDKYGRKKLAIIGNSLIIFVSLLGIARDYLEAFIFFMIGWWFRNFRSPIRRAMMTEVTTPEERSEAFGILHSLDIAGALLAVTYLTLFLILRVSIFDILLFTSIPLIISTTFLGLSKAGNAKIENSNKRLGGKVFWTVIISTMFFGFSQYSFGFPIITTSQITGKDYLGIIAYGIFLGSSSLFGYLFGKVKIKEVSGLAFLGYLLASITSLSFGLLAKMGIVALYPSSFILGISVASTETFEPTIISKVVGEETMGSGMGLLSSGRSIGVFLGNLGMGILYQIHYSYAYYFASLTAFIAFLLVLIRLKGWK